MGLNSALLKRLGIKETQVIQPTKAVRGKKETTDTAFVKDVRGKMNVSFLGHTKTFSASYLEPIFKRIALIGKDNKPILNKQGKPKMVIELDKSGEKVVEGWTPKGLNGQYILEDNGDGTHTATKLNVYKETYIVDSETINEVKIAS